MGSPAGEPGRHGNEGPLHPVAIAQAFALGAYEVTFAQWDVCVAAGGCRHAAADEGWGRGTRPVINIAWSDAVDYAAWLSAITDRQYRLPSEAEWEYAARAGTDTAYYWGEAKGSGNAVCESCGSPWDNRSTAPVCSFAPNAFGLYDMLGNAWEWTADCWNPGYAGAPADGSTWHAGDCAGRVMRGGAWFSFPHNIRSAIRMRGVLDNRYLSKGLRVARTL
jgi:formylglycine-generating enzyme required for sulfatase activity